MDKQEFMMSLRAKLQGLPERDVEESIQFYGEMIDDRIEEGLSEQQAVAQIGCADEIVAQIIADMPFTKIVKNRTRSQRRLKTWEIVLLAVGSPIWASLAIALIAVGLALYVSLWAVIISLWAVFVSVAACALGGLGAGVILVCRGDWPAGGVSLAAGIVCAGLSIFLFYGCRVATKGILMLSKKFAIGIKRCFIKREKV